MDDPNGPSARNLLGLLPFGQKYDDPGEPSMGEWAGGQYKKLKESPLRTLKEAIKDFFAIGN